MIRHLFFDLDDTLYPSASGLWDAIGDRISKYMIERLHLPASEVTALRDHYLHTHGTTLNGLVREHGVDPDDYLHYVHDLPVDRYIRPNPALRAMLQRLPQVKAILTNSDTAHSLRVLNRLGLEDCFQAIIDVHALNWINKPEPAAYQRAMELVGANEARHCLLAEDSLRNLRAAKDMGMFSVYVGALNPGDAADVAIRDICELTAAVPELLNGRVPGRP